MPKHDESLAHLKLQNEIVEDLRDDSHLLVSLGGSVSVLHQGDESHPHSVLSRIFSFEKLSQ